VLEKLTVAVVPGELDVSLVPPDCSPGVLDQDEVGGVPDGGYTVVDPSRAGGVPEDSSLVLLEVVGHLESDGERSSCESFNVGSLGGSDTNVPGDLVGNHSVRSRAGFAGTVFASVGEVLGRGKSSSVVLGPAVGVIGPSSFATISISLLDAVKVLLLGEIPQFSRRLLVPGLQASDSSKGPTGSTASLALHGSHGSFVDPEFLSGSLESSGDRVDIISVGGLSSGVESEVLLLLSFSHGGEEVEAVSGGVQFRVGSSDEFSVLSEDSEPHPVFVDSIAEVLLGLETVVQLEGFLGRL